MTSPKLWSIINRKNRSILTYLKFEPLAFP